MKRKKIHNLLIVDASGSMASKADEVRGGINGLFASLRSDLQDQPEIDNSITVVDFSSHGDFNVLYDKVKPENLVDMTDEDYFPRAMTALYDAIGKALLLVPQDMDGVLVTIFQDAMLQAEALGIGRDKMLAYRDSKDGTAAALKRFQSARKKFSDAIVSEATVDNIFDKKNIDSTELD